MDGSGVSVRSSQPLLLYGGRYRERVEVARRLHAHSPYAEGIFVEARLMAVPCALREEALFGSDTDSCYGTDGWIAQARGGTLLIDELDCLSPVLQQRLLDWMATLAQPVHQPGLRIMVASQHEPSLLVQAGGLIPSMMVWIRRLGAGQCLGPERIEAVRQLAGGGDAAGLAGLAAVLEPVMRSYVEAGLEAGGHALHAIVVGEVERSLITMTLYHTGGNQLKAAALLGLNRNTLRKRIRELQIIMPPRAVPAGDGP